jgi:hypothetical protein
MVFIGGLNEEMRKLGVWQWITFVMTLVDFTCVAEFAMVMFYFRHLSYFYMWLAFCSFHVISSPAGFVAATSVNPIVNSFQILLCIINLFGGIATYVIQVLFASACERSGDCHDSMFMYITLGTVVVANIISLLELVPLACMRNTCKRIVQLKRSKMQQDAVLRRDGDDDDDGDSDNDYDDDSESSSLYEGSQKTE